MLQILLVAPNYNPTGVLGLTNAFHNYIIPLIFLIDFGLTSTRDFQWRSVLEWLVFPLLYLAYAMLLGADSGSYVYFFLDIKNPEVGINVFISWFLILIALFLIVGILIILYNKRFMQSRQVKQD